MGVGRSRVHLMAAFSIFVSLVSFITPGLIVPPVDIVVSLIASSMAVHHTSSNARLRAATRRGHKHQCGCGLACVHSMAISGAVLSVLFGLIGRLALITVTQRYAWGVVYKMISGTCTLINVVILSSIASYTRSDRNSCTCCCARPSAVLRDVSPTEFVRKVFEPLPHSRSPSMRTNHAHTH